MTAKIKGDTPHFNVLHAVEGKERNITHCPRSLSRADRIVYPFPSSIHRVLIHAPFGACLQCFFINFARK